MNHEIKLLDVSLRDGGHRSNFHFSDNQLKTILEFLDCAAVDYIEIGYRNGALNPIPDIGRAGLCDNQYIQLCREHVSQTQIAIMAHPENLIIGDLQQLKDLGVDLLRLCISKGKHELTFPLLEMAHKIGLKTSLNFIHISYYAIEELEAVVSNSLNYRPDIIYFADSNGSMLPPRVYDLFSNFCQKYAAAFGFHAHDNLGLAQTNSIAAMNAGAHYVDASLAGMGKGTGNLRIEFFASYLEAIKVGQYHLSQLLHAANYVRKELQIGQEPLTMDEFTRGIADLSTADLKRYKAKQINQK